MNKEYVLAQSRQGLDLMLHVLRKRGANEKLLDQLNRGKATGGFHNPFYEDTNPSLSVFEGPGVWCFKDHGDERYSGDAFALLALHVGLDAQRDFSELLRIAAEEVIGIGHGNEMDIQEWNALHKGDPVRVSFSERWDYFEQLTRGTVDVAREAVKFGLVSIKAIDSSCRSEEREGFVFGWKLGEALKVYRPLNADRGKFQWINPEGWNRLAWLKHVRAGSTVLLTEGYKDAFMAQINGLCAFPLDNAQSNLPNGLLNELERRNCRAVLCLDNDEAGSMATAKLKKQHQLAHIDLPVAMGDVAVKDLTDLLAAPGGRAFMSSALRSLPEPSSAPLDEFERIKASRLIIEQRSREVIEWPRALFQFNGVDFIFPNSVNVISGHAGVHKSRACENLVATALSESRLERIGLQRNPDAHFEHVLYFDTERNQSRLLPRALQSIRAIVNDDDDISPDRISFYSLINAQRTNRLNHVERFIQEHLLEHKSLLVILDLITDCIYDFNSPTETYSLIDRLNIFKENYDVAFIVVIHLNPGSQKERGHLGTELINKCDAGLQIAHEEGVFVMKAIKNRSQRCPPPLHIAFDPDIENLVATDAPNREGTTSPRRKSKGPSIRDVLVGSLPALVPLDSWSNKKAVMEQLMKTSGASIRSVETKLSEIAEEQVPLNFQGQPVRLELSRGQLRLVEVKPHPQTQSSL